jgi:hypothetical protein
MMIVLDAEVVMNDNHYYDHSGAVVVDGNDNRYYYYYYYFLYVDNYCDHQLFVLPRLKKICSNSIDFSKTNHLPLYG